MYIEDKLLDQLVTTFYSFSFNSNQIKRILKKYRFIKNRSVEEIKECFPYYREQMLKMGYSEYQLRELVAIKPRAIFIRFSRGKIRDEYIGYLEKITENNDTEIIYFEQEKVLDILRDLGFSEQKISYITEDTKDILFAKPEVLQRNIKFYLDNGLEKKDLAVYANRNIKILEHGEEYYQELLSMVKEFNMNMKDICYILKRKKHYASFMIGYVIAIFKWAKEKDLDKVKFKKGIMKTPMLTNLQITAFEDGYKNLLDYGFNESQIRFVLGDAISVLTTSKSEINEKLDYLKKYNMTNEDIIDFVVEYPGYLTMSIENIDKKLTVAEEIGTLDFIFMRPKNLIQGSELTLARAYFLNEYRPDIVGHEFDYIVYYPEVHFIRKIGKSNEEVKAIYQEYLSGKKLTYRQEV